MREGGIDMSEGVKALLGEELYSKVTEKLGEKKIDLLDGYIPKNRFDEVNTSKAQLKTQVGELSNQLEALKGKASGNDDLMKTIAELQGKNKDWETKYQTTLLETAITSEATKEKARNSQDILAFIDRGQLVLEENGKVKGLSTQLTELKKSKPYLFDIAPQQTPGTNPAGTNNNDGENSWMSKLSKLV